MTTNFKKFENENIEEAFNDLVCHISTKIEAIRRDPKSLFHTKLIDVRWEFSKGKSKINRLIDKDNERAIAAYRKEE